MNRPMRGAGRIKLITDITRSDRERLPDWRARPNWQELACEGVLIACACVALVLFGIVVMA
jgi:hypothetical protein